jgi:serine/threonine protein kinase
MTTGNFAKVLQVRKKDNGKIYAMKVLNKKKLEQSDQLEHVKTERTVLQYVAHPFLVRLLYAFQDPEKLYMVMDFINGGELFFHLKKERRFPEHRVKFYSAQLLLALSHLHEQNVVFRDLKPENILMDKDGYIMLTDFGLAKFMNHADRTHTFCGTPEYLAPVCNIHSLFFIPSPDSRSLICLFVGGIIAERSWQASRLVELWHINI